MDQLACLLCICPFIYWTICTFIYQSVCLYIIYLFSYYSICVCMYVYPFSVINLQCWWIFLFWLIAQLQLKTSPRYTLRSITSHRSVLSIRFSPSHTQSHSPVTLSSHTVQSHCPVTQSSHTVTVQSHSPVTQSSHSPVTQSSLTVQSHSPVSQSSLTVQSHSPVTQSSHTVQSHSPESQHSFWRQRLNLNQIFNTETEWNPSYGVIRLWLLPSVCEFIHKLCSSVVRAFTQWCNMSHPTTFLLFSNANGIGRKEGNVLFNNTLNTLCLRLDDIRHMVMDHTDSQRGNPLPPHGLHFPIGSKGSFTCFIPQTG